MNETFESLLRAQADGRIDPKVADGLNTTLKGTMYLNFTLPLNLLKLVAVAQSKKLRLPWHLSPIEVTIERAEEEPEAEAS